MSQILLVNREANTLNILTRLLKTEGYKVTTATDSAVARNLLKSQEFNLMICDLAAGGEVERLDLIREASALRSGMPVITVVEPGDHKVAEKLAALKPFGQIEKPLKVDRLLATVQKAVDYDESLRESVNLNLQLETCYQFENVVAESAAMKSACDMISRVAGTDIAVLLMGESGTGRGALARAIHSHSRRKDKPMVALDCGQGDMEVEIFGTSDHPGSLERAMGGTIFLRNVEKIPVPAQGRVLSALQERKLPGKGVLDVRVVASTTQDLDSLARDGKFDPDFYRLLRVILIRVPPLRERKEDIMPTLRHLLQRKLGEKQVLPTLSQDIVDAMEAYPWPGNAREMERAVETALANAPDGRLTIESLPREIRAARK